MELKLRCLNLILPLLFLLKHFIEQINRYFNFDHY